MLGVDERAGAAALLRLGDRVQRERGLAGTFRAVDLHDPPARQPADPQRKVEPERSGRDHLDMVIDTARAHAHDGALAEGPLDLRHRGIQCLAFFHQGFLILQLYVSDLDRYSRLDCIRQRRHQANKIATSFLGRQAPSVRPTLHRQPDRCNRSLAKPLHAVVKNQFTNLGYGS
jgi:hypothetical protein